MYGALRKTLLLLTLCGVALGVTDGLPSADFVNQDFIGTYYSLQLNPLFGFLDVSTGNIELTLLKDDSRNIVGTVVVDFFNPVYHDGKAAAMGFNLTATSDNSTTWSAVDNADVDLFWKEQVQQRANCTTNYTFSLESDGNLVPDKTTVKIRLESVGGGICDFKLYGELRYHDYKMTAILYCLFVSVVILGQIFSAYKLIKAYTNGQVEANKLSLMTVAFCNIQDFFLTMMHLYFLMAQEQYYIYFILPIFLLVLLSVVFDMKLLFIVWRAKYIASFANNGELRKRLTVFYVKFYLGLFSYLTIMYFFTYDIWSLLIQSLLFMPQIIHNVRKGNNPFFYPYYVLGVLGIRMVLPLYYRGCPSNIYAIEPSSTFCAVWASLFLIQMFVLYLQHKLGPRFFVPRFCIPGYYNYNFKYKVSQSEDVPDCPICLLALNVDIYSDEAINADGSASVSTQQPLAQVNVMRAPCRHLFHKECLRHWIDVKLECPTCRGVLPPLNN